jgi:hypothetical protein
MDNVCVVLMKMLTLTDGLEFMGILVDNALNVFSNCLLLFIIGLLF